MGMSGLTQLKPNPGSLGYPLLSKSVFSQYSFIRPFTVHIFIFCLSPPTTMSELYFREFVFPQIRGLCPNSVTAHLHSLSGQGPPCHLVPLSPTYLHSAHPMNAPSVEIQNLTTNPLLLTPSCSCHRMHRLVSQLTKVKLAGITITCACGN